MASIARKIRFNHLPVNGKTAVYNPTTKKWEYQLDPTAQQLTDASDRLLDIDNNAKSAKNLAESKVDMDDVKSLFPCQVSSGDPVVISTMSFMRDANNEWRIYLCVAPANSPTAHQQCAWLGYPSLSEFNALKSRVENLENRLGIS